MQYLGHLYAKKLFILYVKFKFNKAYPVYLLNPAMLSVYHVPMEYLIFVNKFLKSRTENFLNSKIPK